MYYLVSQTKGVITKPKKIIVSVKYYFTYTIRLLMVTSKNKFITKTISICGHLDTCSFWHFDSLLLHDADFDL